MNDLAKLNRHKLNSKNINVTVMRNFACHKKDRQPYKGSKKNHKSQTSTVNLESQVVKI